MNNETDDGEEVVSRACMLAAHALSHNDADMRRIAVEIALVLHNHGPLCTGELVLVISEIIAAISRGTSEPAVDEETVICALEVMRERRGCMSGPDRGGN